MTPAIKKLIEDIDQLAIWLHENPNTPMPSQHKQKAQMVLQKIINAEVLSEREWETIKPELHKNNSQPKQKQLEKGYIYCEDCGDKLNIKNLSKHKNKCRARKKSGNKSSATSNKGTTRKPRNGVFTDKPHFNERKEERRLDGSRDYWQIRDQGKFGSHPMYDDMGDDAFS